MEAIAAAWGGSCTCNGGAATGLPVAVDNYLPELAERVILTRPVASDLKRPLWGGGAGTSNVMLCAVVGVVVSDGTGEDWLFGRA